MKEKKRLSSSTKIDEKIIEKILSLRKFVKKPKERLETAIFSDFQTAKIDIDENTDDCRNGRSRAKEILKLCEIGKDTFSKDSLIPLQGKSLWCKWSHLDKERRKKGKDCFDPDEDLLKCKVREEQVDRCNNQNIAIAAFVKSILEMRKDDSALLYFIFWVKQELDEVSKRILPNLRRKLQKAMVQTKSSKDSQKVIKLKERIADASFGIEHIFREIGQIYEAFVSMKEGSLNRKTERVIEELPGIVAKLSLLGHPLEIMDGDAANVPILWLKKIFSEINNNTNAEQITSVSVIGVQSSGKSTLLNTMFGIQFPVSAGRCTRGIFTQFIPVSKVSNKFGYLMVIDTEGLRAPETTEEKIDFDNEIAALAIGLSDVSIINIPGETVGEMRDILQIVVHAFIRLKKSNPILDYKQSGIFVHQNVSASDTKDKTLEGSYAFMDHLDKMAEIAAKDEQMPNISTFRAVIDLDLKEDRIYFPNFLENDTSTMPYVSQGYCKAVNVSTIRIFEKLKQNVALCNARDNFWNLRNLWEGIQAETFIFSFRNCQEAIASKMLEKEFQALTWSFEEKKHDWWNKNKQRLIAADLSSVENFANDLNANFSEMISKEAESAKQSLADFIDHHKYKKFMKHFEERRRCDLEHYTKSLKNMIYENINREKNQRLEFLRNYDEIITKQSIIKEEAKDLARRMQNSELDYGQLLETFQSWWNITLNEKCSQYDGLDVIRTKLKTEMEHFLLRFYEIRMKIAEDEECTHHSPRLKGSIRPEDIAIEGICIAEPDNHMTNYPQLVVNVLNLSFEKIDRYFEGLLQKESRFDELHFNTILKYVLDDIDEHNKKHYTFYSITRSLVDTVIKHVSIRTFPVFLHLNKEYETKYGMRSELSKCRVKAFQIFKNTFHEFIKNRQEEKNMKDDVCQLKETKEQILKELQELKLEMEEKMEKNKNEEEEYEQRKNEIMKKEIAHKKELEKNQKDQQERKEQFENLAHEMRLEEESLKYKGEELTKELQQLSEKRKIQKSHMEEEQRKYAENAKKLKTEIAAKERYIEEMNEKSNEMERKLEEQRQRKDLKRKNDLINIESSADSIINELQVVLDEKFAEFLRQKIKSIVVKKFEGQKQNLMSRVLTELAEQESSDNYKSYISSPETYVLKWLTEYSKIIFFGDTEDSQSEYKKSREEFVTPFFSSMKGCATNVTHSLKEQGIRKWVKEYQIKLSEEDILISSTSFDDVEYEIQDFDFFLSVFKDRLTAMKKEFSNKQPEMIKWKDKTPYEEIMNFLWGCKENCPWCNEPCKSSILNHADSENCHECLQHRPVGIHGIHRLDTKILVIESCEFKVQSNHTLQCAKWCGCSTSECASKHLYSDYKKIIPQWKIVPCADMSNSKYWTWVIGKFYEDFEAQYGKKFIKIPNSWKEISKKEAIESLETYRIDEVSEQSVEGSPV